MAPGSVARCPTSPPAGHPRSPASPSSSAAAAASTRSPASARAACCAAIDRERTTSSRSASASTAAGSSRPTTRSGSPSPPGSFPRSTAPAARRPGRRPDRRRPGRLRARRVPHALGEVDVVFPLLHGPYGEDGTVQGLLELAGVPYVGSGVLASAVAMDKATMKIAARGAGLPVGAVRRRHATAMGATGGGRVERSAALGLPVFVKPARAGSSVGITQGRRAGRPRRRHRAGARARPEGARRAGASRARDRVRRAREPWTGRRRRPACAPRSRCRGGARVLRLRGEVPRRRRHRARRAGRPARRRSPTGARISPWRPSRRWAARASPGSTSSSADDGGVAGQRGQHDARLHSGLDVPADVGGEPASTTRRWSTGWSRSACASGTGLR